MATQTIQLTSGSNLSQSGGSQNWTLGVGGGTAEAQIFRSGITNFTMAAVKGSNYGFSIPAGATINGITVRVTIRNLNYNGETTFISNINLPSATAKSFNIPVTGSTSFVSYSAGSSSDKWGRSWTPADINSSSFGPTITNTASQQDRDTIIRTWEVSVNYTEQIDLVVDNISHSVTSDEIGSMVGIPSSTPEVGYSGGWGGAGFGRGWGGALLPGIQNFDLELQSALHTLSSPTVLLAQAHNLAPSNSLHTHTVTSPLLGQNHLLSPLASALALSSTSVSLVEDYKLLVDPSLHLLTSDEIAISSASHLGVQSAFHGLLSPELVVPQLHMLAVDGARSSILSSVPVLVEGKTLNPADSTHSLLSPALTLTELKILGVQDSVHLLTSSVPSLLQAQLLQVAGAAHGLTSEQIAILQYTLLNKPHDSTLKLSSELVNIGQNFVLSVKDGLLLISSKNLEKILDLTELGIDLGRYRPDYKQPGAIELGSVDTGRIREGYGDHGLIETIDPIIAGRYREDYKETGKY